MKPETICPNFHLPRGKQDREDVIGEPDDVNSKHEYRQSERILLTLGQKFIPSMFERIKVTKAFRTREAWSIIMKE
ncbi:unnamed protein product [Dovyalis caffra]|uniref:Uncharacterized protein n=1 Tax=Dovyalis caffra TaxID=77055 RepID=A0AAV1RV10_9ROSI|nr:unnamed protein product [Dovyalis caffra]